MLDNARISSVQLLFLLFITEEHRHYSVILNRVLYGTNLRLVTFMFKTYPIIAFAVELAVPALILLIAAIRKKRGTPATDHPGRQL